MHEFKPFLSRLFLSALLISAAAAAYAWELAARYSVVNLNDNFNSGLTTPGGVGGGRQTVYSAALIWYPNRNMRFMLEFLHGNIAKNFSTQAGGGVAGTPLGGRLDAIALRTQIAF